MLELVRLQAENPELLDTKLKKVFAGIDKDNSGFLDFDEFKVAARKFDLNEECDDIKLLMNQDGIIKYGGENEEELEWESVNILSVKSIEEGKKSNIFKADINKASDQKLCFSIL